jgi:hypothetical protein
MVGHSEVSVRLQSSKGKVKRQAGGRKQAVIQIFYPASVHNNTAAESLFQRGGLPRLYQFEEVDFPLLTSFDKHLRVFHFNGRDAGDWRQFALEESAKTVANHYLPRPQQRTFFQTIFLRHYNVVENNLGEDIA